MSTLDDGIPQAINFSRLVLASILLIAGMTKTFASAEYAATLRAMPLPESLRRLSLVLPFVEIVCAIVLAVGRVGVTSVAFVVSALFLLFNLAVMTSLAQGTRPRCACFGRLASNRMGYDTLARNTVLMMAALVVASRYETNDAQFASGWPGLFGVAGISMVLIVAKVRTANFGGVRGFRTVTLRHRQVSIR